MNFSLAKTIEAYGGKVHSGYFNLYTSTPSKDLINPGFNLQLYSDVVPLSGGQTQTQYLQEKTEAKSSNDEKEDKDGFGKEDEKIIHSFEHPRPIKTETIEVVQRKRAPRAETKGKY